LKDSRATWKKRYLNGVSRQRKGRVIFTSAIDPLYAEQQRWNVVYVSCD